MFYDHFSARSLLVDTVARLQLDIWRNCEPIRCVIKRGVDRPRVPKGLLVGNNTDKFFDAIVLSNGWDDATAALQLLSQLWGDALNVALLVPELKRATRAGLVGALSAGLREGWQIFGASLKRRPGRSGRTLPYLQPHWKP